MGLLIKLSLLLVCLCVLQVYGYEENEYRRTLEAYRILQREQQLEEEQLEKRTCKELGEPCRVQPKCCGHNHCYWEDGFSLLTDGVCVKCMTQNQKCQKNAHCCAGLQCDKENPFWKDGRCVEPRTSGGCYQESQCKFDCKWWKCVA